MLSAYGFSYDQLGTIVFDGLATMQPSVTQTAGRKKVVVWMQISAAGRKAIAE
jgi:hypothetical protein